MGLAGAESLHESAKSPTPACPPRPHRQEQVCAGKAREESQGLHKPNLTRPRAPGRNPHWQPGSQPGGGSSYPRSHSENGAGLSPQNSVSIPAIIQGA